MLSIVLLEVLITFPCIKASIEVFITLDPSDDSNFTLITSDNDISFEEHESFKTCFSIDLSPEEYVLFPNKTAFVSAYKRMYEEHSYILLDDHLRICPPSEVSKEDLALSLFVAPSSFKYFSMFGLGVSMAFLFIHIVVFILVPELRNLHEWKLATLCFSLFLGYLVLLCFNVGYVRNSVGFCIATAVFTQFFFFSSLLWMSILSFDIFRSIRLAIKYLRKTNKEFRIKKYVVSSLICWGISLVFTVAPIIADNVEGVDENFKPHFRTHCWFKTKNSFLVFFGIPVSMLIVLIFILYVFTTFTLYSHTLRLRILKIRRNGSLVTQDYRMYLKLAVILGATWITGAVALTFKLIWLWNLFIVIHIFHCSFIFIAFIFSDRTRKSLKLTWFRKRTTAEGMQLAPSFISYLRFSKFIKKDLDIVVNARNETVPIDAIVTHM
ncbi:g-protein coupled receptor Mth2 [Nephila pilipes]|uniref:G-protein coupled receptor Mth2 n=1 Tax=Nephila pilipes TaxID=299642 RepID=A0A8X6IAK3_NEPPI|nr:g-protein coupled receptor Mth2 [Nephila pilipes]GFT65709.1 g-protein coupled receptor Mth2 [Nephila pilipes]